MKDPKEVLQKLDDKELKRLIDDYKLMTIPEDSIVRKVILEIYGEIDLLVLQMNQLIWCILEVVSERMFHYSPYINL